MKKKILSAAVAALLTTTTATPAHAQAATIAVSAAKSLASAIAGEAGSAIFDAIFGSTGTPAVTQAQVQQIVDTAFTNYGIQDIQTANGTLSGVLKNYDKSDGPDRVNAILDIAALSLSNARSRASEGTQDAAINAYIAGQTANMMFLAERARKRYVESEDDMIWTTQQLVFDREPATGRNSNNFPQPTSLDIDVPDAAIEGLTWLAGFMAGTYNDKKNAYQSCLSKDPETPWVVGNEVVTNTLFDVTNIRNEIDASKGYCMNGNRTLKPQSGDWFTDMTLKNKKWNVFESNVTQGTRRDYKSVVDRYQFAVRVEDGHDDFFMLQEKNKEYADIVRNFHALTKRTSALGNMEEVALAWVDVVIAYNNRFGPNAPDGGSADTNKNLVMKALEEATYLGVDQLELLKRASQAGVDYHGWLKTKALYWGNVATNGNLSLLTRDENDGQCTTFTTNYNAKLVRCFNTVYGS